MHIRWAISLYVLLVLALSVRADASGAKQILVTGSKVGNGGTLILVDFEGRTIELECTSSDPSCRVPKAGYYFMERDANPIYEDCSNVDLFEISSRGERGPKVGTNCDLSSPGDMMTETAPEIKTHPN